MAGHSGPFPQKPSKTLDAFTLPPKATEKKTVYINFEDDNLLLAPEYFIKVLAGFEKISRRPVSG
ncbi:MAG: hypothetical protein R2861_05555 [Desulfobacterales bacterium]